MYIFVLIAGNKVKMVYIVSVIDLLMHFLLYLPKWQATVPKLAFLQQIIVWNIATVFILNLGSLCNFAFEMGRYLLLHGLETHIKL